MSGQKRVGAPGNEWWYEAKTPFERHLAERVEFLVDLVTSLHLKAGETAQIEKPRDSGKEPAKMDTPHGPTCWCGRFSKHESGWCGEYNCERSR